MLATDTAIFSELFMGMYLTIPRLGVLITICHASTRVQVSDMATSPSIPGVVETSAIAVAARRARYGGNN